MPAMPGSALGLLLAEDMATPTVQVTANAGALPTKIALRNVRMCASPDKRGSSAASIDSAANTFYRPPGVVLRGRPFPVDAKHGVKFRQNRKFGELPVFG